MKGHCDQPSGQHINAYEAEMVNISTNGKFVKVVLRCPVDHKVRGISMEYTADRPDLVARAKAEL
jgi:hypothetical protein